MIDVLRIDGVVLNLEVIELILGLFNLIAQGISALRQLLDRCVVKFFVR